MNYHESTVINHVKMWIWNWHPRIQANREKGSKGNQKKGPSLNVNYKEPQIIAWLTFHALLAFSTILLSRRRTLTPLIALAVFIGCSAYFKVVGQRVINDIALKIFGGGLIRTQRDSDALYYIPFFFQLNIAVNLIATKLVRSLLNKQENETTEQPVTQQKEN